MTRCCFYMRYCRFRASSHQRQASTVYPDSAPIPPRRHRQAQGLSLLQGSECFTLGTIIKLFYLPKCRFRV